MMKADKNIPALRFPEFEGEWGNLKLEKIVTSIKSGATKPQKEGKYNVYGSTGIIGKSDYFTHDGQSILIARVGANAGFLNLVFDKYCVTDNTLIVELKSHNSYHFIYYRLIKFNLNRLIFGSGQPLVTAGELKKLTIQIPTLSEQQKIASFLSSIDQRIHLLTQKKEKLEQYKKGIMQQIFSQQLRFKDENGKNYPAWEEKRLGDIAVINPRIDKVPDNFHYIDLESVDKGSLKYAINYNQSDAPSRAQRVLTRGDILFQLVRPYQKNNYYFDLEGTYVASTGYAQIRYDRCPQFVYQMVHSEFFVTKVLNRCTGSSYPAINSSDLGDITELFPRSFEEQQKIATFLSAIDEKINHINSQIELTRKWKQGLLQQMFV